MLLLLLSIVNTLISAVVPLEQYSNRKITVVIPKQNPVALLDDNDIRRGLDVLIIENFAQKFNLPINFKITKYSANYILSNQEGLNTLLLWYAFQVINNDL